MALRFKRGNPDDLRTFHPAYFSLVMATGIVADAAELHGIPYAPIAMFWLNAVFLVGLIIITGLRIRRYPGAFVADIRNHSRGVGFFTSVAAFGVFGKQLLLHTGATNVAIALWVITLVLWFTVMYGVLTVLTVQAEKPSLADGINGGWLVSVVATQSLSILTVSITPAGAGPALQHPLMLFALILWLGGGALYLWLMTLIFFRYTFMRMSPDDFTPPYWINMGAVAISTLAGITLLEQAPLSPVVVELSAFIEGFTLLFWAVGSWWIPMLVFLGMWRYLIREVPFAYDPLYWGGIFPLGMYSVCTYHLTELVTAPFLMPVSRLFMIVALVSWIITLIGLIDSRRKFWAITSE